ncbi:class I SAM-dependent methyltransferase [Chitinophaga eiseniae]|uniref:Class I SAM-dependent methyltransferase n=1 Tax=Chitinophaga eiseniae TaxID=634771 RepID=A0A847SQ38_9BACT|nr:class I SAM-dependent methyltransferase [Chitinophaga eiseniae]NLR82414.1 class I SAM-dependent methyltransferase [Chitinophaga eiseniae]
MELSDAISLINHPYFNRSPHQVWADLGAGSGLFTFALAHLLGSNSSVYAYDKAPVQLLSLPDPPGVNIRTGQLDFVATPLPLQHLDGMLMANSLHYVANKTAFIREIQSHLQPNGVFLVVEYDTAAANAWVPYPVPFKELVQLFRQQGFDNAIKINERPSVFRSGTMYAALFSRK